MTGKLKTVVCAIALAALPAAAPGHDPAGATHPRAHEEGKVSWYGERWAGRRTASGERYDPNDLTMAHRTLPLGSKVKVTNRENDQSVVVRVNDRGPYVAGRVADLSKAAAERLDMLDDGVVPAELQVIAWGDGR